jgi:hypothetical protein
VYGLEEHSAYSTNKDIKITVRENLHN